LSVNVTSATAAVVISSDGGVQVNSNAPGQEVAVDVFLFVDGAEVPNQIIQRRVFAANRAFPTTISNWSFSVALTGLAPGTTHTFRVKAALVGNNGSAAVVGGTGGATGPGVLRGTLTAVVINK
jgi:hypothetical protein